MYTQAELIMLPLMYTSQSQLRMYCNVIVILLLVRSRPSSLTPRPSILTPRPSSLTLVSRGLSLGAE